MAALVVTPEQAVQHLVVCTVKGDDLQRLRNGVLPQAALAEMPPGLIQICADTRLIAVAEKEADGQVKVKRVFN